MPGTLEFTAHDAGYALLIDEQEFRFVATKDGEPFSYFLNPAVYGTGTAFIRWDETLNGNKGGWAVESQPDLQKLDDRYGVGANYLTDHYGRSPFGSALPGGFIKLDDDGSLAEVDVSNLKLTKAYAAGTIVPYLVVKVYEQRLASYDYYVWLAAPLTDATSSVVTDKESLKTALLGQLETALKSGGSIYTVYEEFTGLQLDVSVSGDKLLITNMARFDGHEVQGERFGEITTGHLMLPNVVLPGLTRAVGHEYMGFKPMRGMYTVFAPEKLYDLNKVIAETVGALAALDADEKAAVLEQVSNASGYNWNDFFRGQGQAITVKTGKTTVQVDVETEVSTTVVGEVADSDDTITVADASEFEAGEIEIGEDTFTVDSIAGNVLTLSGVTGKVIADGATVTQTQTVTELQDKAATETIRAKVFFAAYGAQQVGATVEVIDEDGTVTEVANSVGIVLADDFSYVDETFHQGQPTAQRFTTGPRGAQGIVNDDGSITWLNDAYSV